MKRIWGMSLRAGRLMGIALAVAAVTAGASVANAGFNFGMALPNGNVVYDVHSAGTQQDPLLYGTVKQGTDVYSVIFEQPVAPEELKITGEGLATIEAVDGGFTSLEISLEDGYFFTAFEANAGFPNNVPLQFIVTAYDPATSSAPYIVANGVNRFSVTADGGTLIRSVRIVASTANSLTDMKQIYIGGIQAAASVPEPGTAALLATGVFGFAGNLYRRRRRAA